MPSYQVSRKAQSDLLAIGKFTTKKWGRVQRNHYLKLLDDCFSQLAADPGFCIRCDYITKGYRKFPQASHLIFYKLDQDGVVKIIRVLHEAMDAESKF